jgi:hypothetical protein
MSSMNSSQRKVCEGSGVSGKPHFSETTVASDEELRWIDDGLKQEHTFNVCLRTIEVQSGFPSVVITSLLNGCHGNTFLSTVYIRNDALTYLLPISAN